MVSWAMRLKSYQNLLQPSKISSYLVRQNGHNASTMKKEGRGIMAIQKCSSSTQRSNTQCQGATEKKPQGRAIAYLQRESTALNKFEKETKKIMQDRMKFMSCKNAMRMQARLCQIDHQKEILKEVVSVMQKT